MKKLFNRKIAGAILVVMLALVIVFPVSINAYRGTEAIYSGRIKLDGGNVPVGCTVTARIDRSTWEGKTYFSNESSRYSVSVPCDSGSGTRDGGVEGDLVYFSLTVDGKTYEYYQPEPWLRGMDINLNLFFVTPQVEDLVIETSSLPEGVVGAEYSETGLIASGGTEPYMWEAVGLPDGIYLTNDGILFGSPTAVGEYLPEFTVRDSTAPQLENTKAIQIKVWLMGDADHNGIVDNDDITMVIKIYLGFEDYTISADVNQDGTVDILDAILIRNMI